MQIIGITGKINSGKTTIANLLCKNNFIKMSYSTALKQTVGGLFSIDGYFLYTQEGKEKMQPFWGMSTRTILQKFGTDAIRKVFGSGFWVKILENRIKEQEEIYKREGKQLSIVIDDVRFESEAQLILDYGGEVWEVLRTPPRHRWVEWVLYKLKLLHESEKRIPAKYISVEIGNFDDLCSLTKKVTTLYRV